MSRTDTPTYDALRGVLQQLVEAATVDAVDFVNDMLDEEDLKNATISSIEDQAVSFLITLIDEDNGGIQLPTKLENATREFVRARVKYAIKR